MKATVKEQVLKLNSAGIIPGPGEDDLAFAKRAEYCLAIKEHFLKIFEGDPLFENYEPPSDFVTKEGYEKVFKMYGFSPDWAPVFFSNYGLAPWHGGCAWIIQVESDTPTTGLFQLRKRFKDRNRFLGTYTREELIAHESCHVGRMMFEEPKFEEYLAYMTSENKFRKVFGPIIQSKGETLSFMITIIAVILMDLFFLFSGHIEGYFSMMWFKSLPLLLVCYGLIRLVFRRYRLNLCIKNVSKAVNDKSNALAVVFRLTDDEIMYFGKMSPGNIRSYFEEYMDHDLRCYLIHEAYFNR